VDRFVDVPVSFALVRWEGGRPVERRCGLVDPGRAIPLEAVAVHGIPTERARSEGLPLDEAVGIVVDALVDAARREVPVVGMKLDFDLTMIDAQCRRIEGCGLEELAWWGPVLDAVVLDRHFDQYRAGRRTLEALCRQYGVINRAAHDAAGDAEAALGVLAAMSRRYPELSEASPEALHEAQVEWHRAWARDLNRWRLSQGWSPLFPGELVWPVAPPDEPAWAA
jgi:DNA polymerase-3 subunit epsilon